MRKVIVGDVRNDARLVGKINRAWRLARKIVLEECGDFEMDCVFFAQKEINDTSGVCYYKLKNYVEVRVSSETEVKMREIAATIVQALTTIWIEKFAWKEFDKTEPKARFMFDLFRTGAALKMANRLGVKWEIDEMNQEFLEQHKDFINKILSEEAEYDEQYWFDETGKNPYFAAWFVGEKIINEIYQKYQIVWQKITAEIFMKYLNLF